MWKSQSEYGKEYSWEWEKNLGSKLIISEQEWPCVSKDKAMSTLTWLDNFFTIETKYKSSQSIW